MHVAEADKHKEADRRTNPGVIDPRKQSSRGADEAHQDHLQLIQAHAPLSQGSARTYPAAAFSTAVGPRQLYCSAQVQNQLELAKSPT